MSDTETSHDERTLTEWIRAQPATRIPGLQRELAKVRAELNRMRAERDRAVAQHESAASKLWDAEAKLNAARELLQDLIDANPRYNATQELVDRIAAARRGERK